MERLETTAVFDGVISETIGDGESVTFRTVRDARVPQGVTKFLFAKVLEATIRERGAGREHGPVAAALLRTMALEHRYDRKEFISALRDAVGFLSDYLVRPREALLRWITEDRNEAAPATVEKRLAAVHDYRYLPILLSAWLRKRKLQAVTRDQLRTVIGALDDRVTAGHSPEELGLLARPIFLFARYGGSQDVQLSVLREFYLEKKLDPFWDALQAQVGTGVHAVTITGLLNAIKATVSAPGKPAVPEIQAVSPAELPSMISEVPEPAEPPALTAETSLPGAVGPALALPDLSSLVSPEHRELFVQRMFGRDADYYTAVISSLNSLPTWKEAAMFLSQFYQTNGLDPFADEVVEFTDAVHHRYDLAVRR